jgi:hypothetical protein
MLLALAATSSLTPIFQGVWNSERRSIRMIGLLSMEETPEDTPIIRSYRERRPKRKRLQLKAFIKRRTSGGNNTPARIAENQDVLRFVT